MPKLDYLGRTTIPIKIRKALNLQPEDELDIQLNGYSIVIEPVLNKCRICGSPTSDKVGKIPLCNTCLRELNEQCREKMG